MRIEMDQAAKVVAVTPMVYATPDKAIQVIHQMKARQTVGVKSPVRLARHKIIQHMQLIQYQAMKTMKHQEKA